MNENDKKAYSEVVTIMSEIEDEYIQKIPRRVLETLEKSVLEDYKPTIEISKPLTEQNLNPKTFDILACLYLNYWCENEEEKKSLLNIYSENEKKEKEKYEINFSKNRLDKKETKGDETQILVTEEKKWFKKIFEKIYSFFKKKI